MDCVPWHIVVAGTGHTQDITLTALLDHTVCFGPAVINQTQTIEIAVPEQPGNHCIELVMAGKSQQHTKLDSNGHIVDDWLISVQKIDMDDIDITNLFYQNSIYKHNFNGGGAAVDDAFFGTMGYNGTVELKFHTPSYVWLLEKN